MTPEGLQVVASRLELTTKQAALAVYGAERELRKAAQGVPVTNASAVRDVLHAAAGVPTLPPLVKRAAPKSASLVEGIGSSMVANKARQVGVKVKAKALETPTVKRLSQDVPGWMKKGALGQGGPNKPRPPTPRKLAVPKAKAPVPPAALMKTREA